MGALDGAAVGNVVGACVGAEVHTWQRLSPAPLQPQPEMHPQDLNEHVESPHEHVPLLSSHLAHSLASHPPADVGACVGSFVGILLGATVGAFVGGSVGHATSESVARITPSELYSARM